MTSLTRGRTRTLRNTPATFSKRLERLATRGTALRDAGKKWARMYVEFCRDYTDTYRTAKELDANTDTTARVNADTNPSAYSYADANTYTNSDPGTYMPVGFSFSYQFG